MAASCNNEASIWFSQSCEVYCRLLGMFSQEQIPAILSAMESTITANPDDWTKAAVKELVSKLLDCEEKKQKKLAVVLYNPYDIIKIMHPYIDPWTQSTHYDLHRLFVHYSAPYYRRGQSSLACTCLKLSASLWVHTFSALDFDLNGDRDHFILNKNTFPAAQFENVMTLILERVRCVRKLCIDDDKSKTWPSEDKGCFKLMQDLFDLLTNRQCFALRHVVVRATDYSAFPMLIGGLLLLDVTLIESLDIDTRYMESPKPSQIHAVISPFIRSCLVVGNLRHVKLQSSSSGDSSYNKLFFNCMADVMTKGGPIDVEMLHCPIILYRPPDFVNFREFLNNVPLFKNSNSTRRNVHFHNVSLRLTDEQPHHVYHQYLYHDMEEYCAENSITLTRNATTGYVLTKHEDVLTIRHISIMVIPVVGGDEMSVSDEVSDEDFEPDELI